MIGPPIDTDNANISAGNAVGPRKPKIPAYCLIAAIALVCIVVGIIAFTQMPANNAGFNDASSATAARANDSTGNAGGADTPVDSVQTGGANVPDAAGASSQTQTDDTDARYAAYRKLVMECESRYGVGKTEKANNGNVTQAKGTFLAELIDFDADGGEELLLGYYDESQTTYHPSDNFADAKAYRTEIWGYENGNSVKLHEPSLHYTNGGFAYLPLYQRNDGVALHSVDYGTDSSNRSFVTNGIWTLENGSFSKITEFTEYGLWGVGDTEYVIDGKSVDQATYDSHLDNVLGDHTKTCYCLMTTDGFEPGGGYWDNRIDPDGIIGISSQTAKELDGDGAGAGDSPAANADNPWAQFPQSFTFTSGAGAWSTDLTVAADGTFTGCFHDSDMGDTGSNYPNGTRRETHFEGSFTAPVKVDDHEYHMQLARLKITDEPGETMEDGVRVIHVTDSVYGLGNETDQPTGEFSLHLPGQPVSVFSEEAATWLFLRYSDSDITDFYAIVNSSDPGNDFAFRTNNY